MSPRTQTCQNIRMLREQKEITQAAMAEKLGLSETGYAKIERGESGLSIERIYQIAEVLDVSVAEIVLPFRESVIACNHSDFSNSTNFKLSVGNISLEAEIEKLNELLLAKNDILASREREIDSLKQQIDALNKLVSALEK